ncbi:MAG: DUF5678 domain-containing protein [Candidatus Anammoxibacter sp.]
MNAHVLVKDSEVYSGQYVATKSFVDKEVICHGDNPISVTAEAKEKGINDPVVFYIPPEDVVQIYQCL